MSDLIDGLTHIIKGKDWEIDNPLVEGLLGVGAVLFLGAAAFRIATSEDTKVTTPVGSFEINQNTKNRS